MNTILTISLRNLFRQKRRNILLGITIAFSMTILVMANSFIHGISDTIFNKIIVYSSGHVNVGFSEKGDVMRQVFRDGPRMKELVQKAAPEIRLMQESIGTMVRAIGNGKTDNMVIVGLDRAASDSDPEMRANDEKAFRLIEGSYDDLGRSDVENPVFVSVQKAKSLNVKNGDYVRIRFRDINGHDVAHRLTIVGLFKTDNVFMQMPMFVDIATAKKVLGYREWETASLQIRLNKPKKIAAGVADRIHEALKPGIAVLAGPLCRTGDSTRCVSVNAFALRTDSLGKAVSAKTLRVIAGDTAKARSKTAIIASASLAQELSLAPGDTVRLSWQGKYEKQQWPARFVISAIAADPAGLPGSALLVNERDFYTEYNQLLPKNPKNNPLALLPKSNCTVLPALGLEWFTLERSHSSSDMMSKMRQSGQRQLKATTVDVASMFEMASMVLQLEWALNLITLIGVGVLFIIIGIGVINTLRMTIRERTREIGTLRAIGMQQNDVRNSFLFETMFLSLFSTLTGIAAAFGLMGLLHFYRFPESDNPMAMLLDSQHLYFLPDPLAIAFFLVLIVSIAMLTAFFPARRAAKLSAAEALRHYE